MENKKFIIGILFFILTSILLSDLVLYLNQNNSNIYFSNFNKDNEFSASNSNILLYSQTEEGNQTSVNELQISNSLEIIGPISKFNYTSYNGGNITIKFNIIDLNYSNRRVVDENNQATFLISYYSVSNTNIRGTLSNFISFSNQTKKFSGIIETSTLFQGTYNITMDMDLLDYKFVPFNFTLTLKTLLGLQMNKISDKYGRIKGSSTFAECNITVEFMLLEMSFNISEVLDKKNQATYLISYYNSSNTNINGTLENHIIFDNLTETYSGIIKTFILPEGSYTIKINVTLSNYTFVLYGFYLTFRKYLILKDISIFDPGGKIENVPGKGYATFIGANITAEFMLFKMECIQENLLDVNNTATYLINYYDVSNPNLNGTITNNIRFDHLWPRYSGDITTSILLEGNFSITIDIDVLNKTFITFTFVLIVKKKYNALITVYRPNRIIVGEYIQLSVYAENSANLEGLVDVPLSFLVSINNGTIVNSYSQRTDENGHIMIKFAIPLKAKTMSLDVSIANIYYIEDVNLKVTDIRVITLSEVTITLIIYIGLITSFIIFSTFIYLKFIIPKNRKSIKILNDYSHLFEDISKIDHIFIILKKNEKSIFYKSYISEKINQQIISKYISTLSFLNKTHTKSQNLISETKYEGKFLLLTNGKYLGVSLILNSEGSTIFKNNLKAFIFKFENHYKNELESWQDNLIPYKEIEKLLEDYLNIYLILPHKVENDSLNKIKLLKPDSMDLLNMTKNLLKKTGVDFFYISTLLKVYFKRSNKGILKFIINFQDLRKNQIFTTKKLNLLIEEKGKVKIELREDNKKLYQYLKQFKIRNDQVLLSIVLPVFNEENIIYSVLKNLPKNDLIEIIVVDDYSKDKSLKEIERIRNEKEIKLIKLKKNKGYGGALITGVNEAKGDVVVTMDSDGQHSPSDIISLIKPIFNGEADLTIGSRYLGVNNYNLPLITRLGEALIEKLIQIFFGLKIMNNQNGFRALNKRIIPLFLKAKYQDFTFPTEIILETILKGFRIKECPVNLYHRQFGSSKVNLYRLTLNLFLCLLIKYIKKFKMLPYRRNKRVFRNYV